MKLNPIYYCLLFMLVCGCSSLGTGPDHSLSTETDASSVYKSICQNRLDTEPKRLVADGIKALEKGRYAAASKKFNEALKLRPDKSYYHLLNALTYHLTGIEGNHPSLELAEQGYKLAIKFDSSNGLASYFLGLLFLDQGHYDKAQGKLADALLLQPDDPAILNAFAYASYYSRRPDISSIVFNTIDKKSLSNRTFLKNATMIMAALGERQNAEKYYNNFKESYSSPEDQTELNRLARRMNEWQNFYSNNARLLNASSNVSSSIQKSGDEKAAAITEPQKIADDMKSKMVIVDVVIILTEENITTARGVNLLNSLRIEFGNTLKSLPAYGKDWTNTIKRSLSEFADDITEDKELNIVQALSIPAITYSLNIANAHNQRNEILARPTLIALADKTSTFFSGFELNASTLSKDSLGNTIGTNIEKQIGVKLTVVPTFLNDGRLMINVNAERTFLRTPSAAIEYEHKIEASKNMVNANVVMRYGESLILSGLSEKEAENVRDGFPFLQDIPIVQYLFSAKATKDYQKSVLILMTPRSPEYVYQPENASAEYDRFLNDYEKPLDNLRARYGDWFKPYPNWAPVFDHLQRNSLYREFRTGDVELEKWSDLRSLKQRFKQIIEFLYY